ncbi:MAG: hypothetical protein FD155_759 [Bacteroidetes bacterium]|nr:MAG: hypothetical protein FD155_759 [Bacteroidota bacterium]
MKHLLIILFLFPFLLNGQTSKGLIVKTLVFQDAFHQNPNLVFEKIINRNYSVELLLALRNGDWYNNGGEGPPAPHFSISTGYTIGLSTKYYLTKRKVIPDSWFVSGIFRFNSTTIKTAEIQTGIHSEPRRINLNRKGPEIGFIFGRQLLFLKHFTTELYVGGGTYLQYYEEEFISGPENEVIPKQTVFTFRPYLGLTLGYIFRKK